MTHHSNVHVGVEGWVASVALKEIRKLERFRIGNGGSKAKCAACVFDGVKIVGGSCVVADRNIERT